MKNKNVIKWKILVFIILAIILTSLIFFLFNGNQNELKTIQSKGELERIYKGENNSAQEIAINILGMPFSLLINSAKYALSGAGSVTTDEAIPMNPSTSGTIADATSGVQSNTSKDYSTTNIQVENVDEADIIKTDGDYIYSISENNVVITNVENPEDIKISAKFQLRNNSIPEDLILYQNKLVIISTETNESNYYYNNNNTLVSIYDITNKEVPRIIKHYTLYEPYYTSRCIDNKLYVIASGRLRKENNNIVTHYTEDYETKEIGFNNMYYLDEVKTNKQTIISMLDLNEPNQNVKLNSYFIDISNAYVSENNIYLLEQNYENNSVPPISSLFGLWGAIGPFKYSDENEWDYGTYTKVFKLNILENGTVRYGGKAEVKGRTIDQYSMDEYEGNLRMALYDNEGSRIVIFDKDLKEIGQTPKLAKGENMYSSRFMGNKAYLVTYKTMDPLYAIDLSDATKPKVLGELKIPGYSTYLHPYDENHLIGIGMETQETVNRDYSGRVISTTARIVGMKMALFDVSDVGNPIQMSSVVIGDSRTTSAILTNPKALLFSKEKELIAIPVNNYAEDFSINNTSDTYSTIINSYKNYNKSYIAEGYAVYKINLKEGFKLKGMITHENDINNSYYNYRSTKLLRGLYIDENLYTVSENQVKVNNLDTLKLLDEIKLK